MQEDLTQPVVIPVIEEELLIGTREIKTGSVRVRKEVQRTRYDIETPLLRDVVSVRHVALNRVIEDMPEIREEGEILIIPVVEEEIIVQKRLVLKEEIHIHRRRVEEIITHSVTLDRERAAIERMDSDGNVVVSDAPEMEHTERD